MRRIVPLLAIVAAGAALVAFTGGGAAAAAGTKPVQIKTFQFSPDPITIKQGQKVKWTNLDATIHTVVAGTRKNPRKKRFFASLDKGETYTKRFRKAGTYRYFCDRHSGPGMTAKVVVK